MLGWARARGPGVAVLLSMPLWAALQIASVTRLRCRRRVVDEQLLSLFSDPHLFDRFNETVLAVHSELRLDVALQRIVELARELVGARYAALGIIGADGYLSDFITTGLTNTERETIGPLPRGHGILGVLIRDQRSLRLPNLHDDPRSSGFPPHHPPMTSFLGVPIQLGEEAIGNFYLTDKQGTAEFSTEDQQLVEQPAQHAAVAVLNARRYTETEFQWRQLRAIIDHMPEAVAIREVPGGRLLIANDRARDLLGTVTLPAGGVAGLAGSFRPERPSGQAYEVAQIPTMRALAAGETVVDEEVVIRDAQGRAVRYAVRAIPVRNTAGDRRYGDRQGAGRGSRHLGGAAGDDLSALPSREHRHAGDGTGPVSVSAIGRSTRWPDMGAEHARAGCDILFHPADRVICG